MSALRTMVTETEDKGASGNERRLKNSLDALIASFMELREVLELPTREYRVIETFHIRVLGGTGLAASLSALKAALAEVRSPRKPAATRAAKAADQRAAPRRTCFARACRATWMQALKPMQALVKILDRGDFVVTEYGTKQLKQILTAGSYSFYNLPLPACADELTEERLSHIETWSRDQINEAFLAVCKVCALIRADKLRSGHCSLLTRKLPWCLLTQSEAALTASMCAGKTLGSWLTLTV